ncbi:MAG: hypothetical protein LBS86_04985, partial [Treponema sp.]|nr:hypothetical protein [Treponema sp.]
PPAAAAPSELAPETPPEAAAPLELAPEASPVAAAPSELALETPAEVAAPLELTPEAPAAAAAPSEFAPEAPAEAAAPSELAPETPAAAAAPPEPVPEAPAEAAAPLELTPEAPPAAAAPSELAPETPPQATAPPEPPPETLNTELVNRLIDELALIRNELAGIRQELSRVNERGERNEQSEHSEKAEIPAAKPVEAPPATPPPLDDNKKIVLTGDELRDIFNTERPAHKNNAPPPVADDDDDMLFNMPSIDNGRYEELERMLEEGIQSMTQPPLDTSYLEMLIYTELGDNEPTLDLSNAVIDEPELSGVITEQPLEEPSFESLESISLDSFSEWDDKDAPSDSDMLIDDLLIDSGSMKDIPLDLGDDKPDSDISDFEQDFEQEDENDDDDEDEDEDEDDEEEDEDDSGAKLEVPFSIEDLDDLEALDDITDALPEKPVNEETVSLPEKQAQERIEPPTEHSLTNITSYLTEELKHVLSYMDRILDSLPDDRIKAFTDSEHFDTYKRVFTALGLA